MTWLHVRDIIDSLLIERVKSGTPTFSFSLSAESFEVLRDFEEQMDTAYIHPRRDAFHLSLCSSRYANFRLPANLLAARLSLLA